jgi:hypothetical protein
MEYIRNYAEYANELKVAAPGADLIGSWFVAIGNQVRKQ